MPIWTTNLHLVRPRDTLQAHGVQQRARRPYLRWMHHGAYHPQSSGLIENWNGQLKHLLSKMGFKGMRGWLTCFQERVLTLNMRGTREGPQWIDSWAFPGDVEKEVREDTTASIPFFPTSPQPSFFQPDAVVPGQGCVCGCQKLGRLLSKNCNLTLNSMSEFLRA